MTASRPFSPAVAHPASSESRAIAHLLIVILRSRSAERFADNLRDRRTNRPVDSTTMSLRRDCQLQRRVRRRVHLTSTVPSIPPTPGKCIFPGSWLDERHGAGGEAGVRPILTFEKHPAVLCLAAHHDWCIG